MYYWAVALLNINLQDKDRWSAVLLAHLQENEGKSAIFLACEEEHITWTVYSIDLFFSSATKVSLHYIIWSMLASHFVISAFL